MGETAQVIVYGTVIIGGSVIVGRPVPDRFKPADGGLLHTALTLI